MPHHYAARVHRTDLSAGTDGRILALEPSGPRVPGLRMECAEGGRLLLRQQTKEVDTPLLLGRVQPWNQGVRIHRLAGYRSPIPPLRSAIMRRGPHWAHYFADHLHDAANGPLHQGHWLLGADGPPYAWGGDLVRDWPSAYLDWFGMGWNGVIPLRPLSDPQDGRVKSYCKHAREGTLAPILLWWISGLDGYLLLDGHDRLVAAREEGLSRPASLILARGLDAEARQAAMAQIEANAQQVLAEVGPHGARARDAVQRSFGEAAAAVALDRAPTLCWPLPGGAPAWDALAAEYAPEWAAGDN